MSKFYLLIYTLSVLLLMTKYSTSSTITNVTMANINIDTPIYYNVKTNTVIPIKSADATRLPIIRPIKLISEGLPCSCSNLRCGCCAGLNISVVNLDRHACANLTLLPQEFAIDFHLSIDDNTVYTNRLTARNPPPVCVPLYFFPVITFCVRFFDLHVVEKNFNACIDFETKVAQFPLFILHFNCVEIGGGGIDWVTPSSAPGGDTATAVTPSTALLNANANANADEEVYDHVNFELSDQDSYSHTSTLTPEEEHQIGALKLENYNSTIY